MYNFVRFRSVYQCLNCFCARFEKSEAPYVAEEDVGQPPADKADELAEAYRDKVYKNDFRVYCHSFERVFRRENNFLMQFDMMFLIF